MASVATAPAATEVPPTAAAAAAAGTATNPPEAATEAPPETAEDEYLISCRCESARAVANLLECLRHVASYSSNTDFKETSSRRIKASNSLQPVTVFCSPTNLTFHVLGPTKQTQASVDMNSGLFSEFSIATQQPQQDNDEQWQAAGGEFCLNLSTVLDCLHLFGSTTDRTTLSFTYNLTKEIFKLELLEEDSGVLSTAAIPGLVPPTSHSLALAFRSSDMVARIILTSTMLVPVLQELEWVAGATVATVSLGSEGLQVAAVGHFGECLVQVPAKGSHVVSMEVANTATIPRSYPLNSLLGSLRGLDIAQETCLTMNAQGMMAIQHQVVEKNVGNGNPNFVDFILCCLQDDEDDEDNEAAEQTSAAVGSSAASATQSYGWTQEEQSKAQSSMASQSRTNNGDDDTSDDDDEDKESTLSSAAPLFGTVVRDSMASASSASSTTQPRSVRPRPPSRRPGTRHGRRRSSRRVQESPNLLQDASEDGSSSSESSSSREEETEPLDVTVQASPHPRDRDDQCSSPELVYGRQH